MTDEISKAWDRFEERFYATASREELVESLRQMAGYNRYLLRISGNILKEKLDADHAKKEAK